jgi:photosystem I subunit 2
MQSPLSTTMPPHPTPNLNKHTLTKQTNKKVEEFYVITWEAPKEQIFEMPLGGAAIMRKGPNLLKLARKEHCLALTTQLRNKFKLTPCFYRVYPTGEVEYLHPKDGVYPEKVNAGRAGENQNMRRIGENVNPIKARLASFGLVELLLLLLLRFVRRARL